MFRLNVSFPLTFESLLSLLQINNNSNFLKTLKMSQNKKLCKMYMFHLKHLDPKVSHGLGQF